MKRTGRPVLHGEGKPLERRFYSVSWTRKIHPNWTYHPREGLHSVVMPPDEASTWIPSMIIDHRRSQSACPGRRTHDLSVEKPAERTAPDAPVSSDNACAGVRDSQPAADGQHSLSLVQAPSTSNPQDDIRPSSTSTGGPGRAARSQQWSGNRAAPKQTNKKKIHAKSSPPARAISYSNWTIEAPFRGTLFIARYSRQPREVEVADQVRRPARALARFAAVSRSGAHRVVWG